MYAKITTLFYDKKESYIQTKEIINKLEGEGKKIILFLISKMMPVSIRRIENESSAKVYQNMWNSCVIYDVFFIIPTSYWYVFASSAITSQGRPRTGKAM